MTILELTLLLILVINCIISTLIYLGTIKMEKIYLNNIKKLEKEHVEQIKSLCKLRFKKTNKQQTPI